MKVTANGIGIEYVVDGYAGPWVVLANSLMTTMAMWDPLVPALVADGYRVLRYDQRGHGRTEVTDGPYDFGLLVDDHVALLDVLSIERAHHIGLSMGGTTVLGVALHRPARVISLVICDTSASSSPAGAAQWAERCTLARREGMSALVEPTITRWFPSEVVAAGAPHLAEVRQMVGATPVAGLCGGAAALSDVRYAESIEDVLAPLLFLVGAQDGLLPDAMRTLHERAPGSRFAELDGAGHLSVLDAPAAFAGAVLGFLHDVDLAGAQRQ